MSSFLLPLTIWLLLLASVWTSALPLPVVEVRGLISADQTWSPENEYLISAHAAVAVGVTLRIEPGTRITLGEGVNFIVNGRLIALGTPAKRILFTRANTHERRWGNIAINGSVGNPETQIAYAHIEFNGRRAIACVGASVFLDNLTFGSTDQPYIDLEGSSFIVSNCHFPSASANFEMLHGNQGIRAGGHGIFVKNFFGSTQNYNDVIDFTGGNRPGPIVHFIDNVFMGSSDDSLDIDGTDAWVEGNIFLHTHRNGSTPDSGAAVSGGSRSGLTSEITIVGNLFYDCDQAATAKQGNFYVMLNNTMVRMTRQGGIDTGDGVITVRDLDPTPTTFGAGFYMEANVIQDINQLVRNYSPSNGIVSFVRNVLPVAWEGPGTDNIVASPRLKHIPTLSETQFQNWQEAQVMWEWFGLRDDSPARSQAPSGQIDLGGVIPIGVQITGTPKKITNSRQATLVVGFNRSGGGILPAFWPEGAGYTHFKWRLNGGPWSEELPISTPITLSNLADGPHYVEVTGKRDSGLYQDDPRFGPAAVVSRTPTWIVTDAPLITKIARTPASVAVSFSAVMGQTYRLEASDSVDSENWGAISEYSASAAADVVLLDTSPAPGARFYRVVKQ